MPGLKILIGFFILKLYYFFFKDKLLEKELKAPYFPPLDKIITDAEIKKKESEKK